MTSPKHKKDEQTAGAQTCPMCGAQVAKDYAPFCSKRCADIDLHRWLTEGYAIPAQEDESDRTPPEADKP